MQNSNFTPGPWVVDETKAFGAYGVWTDYAVNPGHDGAGYGIQICSVITPDLPQTCKDDIKGQRNGNASLIAAAPDLLAALEAMWEAFVPYSGTSPEQEEAIGLARAAINKAKGVSP